MYGLHALLVAFVFCIFTSLSFAAQVTVTIHSIDSKGIGKSIGTVRIADHKEGLVLIPKLKGLQPGEHGFHFHENPSCEPKQQDGQMTAGLAAGGHYNPDKAGKHAGPTGHRAFGRSPGTGSQ